MTLVDFINVVELLKPEQTCKPFLENKKKTFINGIREQTLVSSFDDIAHFKLGLPPVVFQISCSSCHGNALVNSSSFAFLFPKSSYSAFFLFIENLRPIQHHY
jgi:hypothetical protein